MNCRKKADDVCGRGRKQKSRFHICAPIAVAVTMLFMIGCATTPTPPLADETDTASGHADMQAQEAAGAQRSDMGDNAVGAPDESNAQEFSSTGIEAETDKAFPTFLETGSELCTNKEGRPVIYMFSSATCPHCQWGGSAFDLIAGYYSAKGLIEAHHYDFLSGDDLLTEEVETEIPADKLELYHQGDPKDLIPYYNFGCKYDRIGNGYEQSDDLAAEGEEMRRVIDALIRMTADR